MVAATNDVVQLLADRSALATVRFHISTTNSGATYDGSSNWVDLGAVDPASPAFDFNKSVADVMTGTPMTIKQRHITEYQGTMSAELIDYTDNGINATIGTNVPFEITSPMGWTDTTVAAGASTRSHLFLTSITGLSVGDRIAVELGNASYTWFEMRKITAITPGTSPAGEVELQGTLSQIPAVGADIKLVEEVKNTIGGNILLDYQARAVASFNDGSTMVIYAPKGNFTGTMSPNFGDGTSPVKIPIEFGLIGTAGTLPGFNCPQVVLAYHYAFYGDC